VVFSSMNAPHRIAVMRLVYSSPISGEHMHAFVAHARPVVPWLPALATLCCALLGASVRLTWLLKHTRSALHTLLPHTVLPKGRHRF
jgi:hypothetical protein